MSFSGRSVVMVDGARTLFGRAGARESMRKHAPTTSSSR